jgi:hypothetical protein
MKRKVFISGPIQGMETEQSYRDVIRKICVRSGYEPVDPWEREKIIYKGTEAGTCMELFYAKLKHKKTICICQIKNPSPWIIVHSDMILKKIEELEDALKRKF